MHVFIYARHYTARYNLHAPPRIPGISQPQHIPGELEHPAESISGTKLARLGYILRNLLVSKSPYFPEKIEGFFSETCESIFPIPDQAIDQFNAEQFSPRKSGAWFFLEQFCSIFFFSMFFGMFFSFFFLHSWRGKVEEKADIFLEKSEEDIMKISPRL